MSDRVARLSALRRNRKSKVDPSETKVEDLQPKEELGKAQALEQEKPSATLISDPIEATEADLDINEPVEEDKDTQEQVQTVTETLSYNSDLKRDISGLLSKSQRATDNALKKIIREKFQQLQESGN